MKNTSNVEGKDKGTKQEYGREHAPGNEADEAHYDYETKRKLD